MNNIIKNILPYGIVQKHLSNKVKFTEESCVEPKIYNLRGERMRVFYLKNSLNAHTPYSMVAGRISDRIFWDRFNEGLPIHFYSHRDMFNTSKAKAKKFGVLRESEAIAPKDYADILSHPEKAREFEKIFTHSAEILNKFPNALFVPSYGVWYGTERYGGTMSDTAYLSKTKEVSVIASDKQITAYHRMRLELAKKACLNAKVDGYGKGLGNYVRYKADALTDYRYSIVVENGVFENYFTEKILDCFASMTVPIYLGAPNIGDFFNTDGIITVKESEIDSIDEVLKRCNASDYEDRLSAIKDNYERVQRYLDFESYIMDNYGDLW